MGLLRLVSSSLVASVTSNVQLTINYCITAVEFYGDPHALPRRRGGSLQANVILERNSSLHSASPSTARFIDVTDLREALDGATRNVTDSRLRSTTDLEGNSRDISPRSASLRSFGDKGPGGPVRRLNPEDAKVGFWWIPLFYVFCFLYSNRSSFSIRRSSRISSVTSERLLRRRIWLLERKTVGSTFVS